METSTVYWRAPHRKDHEAYAFTGHSLPFSSLVTAVMQRWGLEEEKHVLRVIDEHTRRALRPDEQVQRNARLLITSAPRRVHGARAITNRRIMAGEDDAAADKREAE
jgi:hypothetical protein